MRSYSRADSAAFSTSGKSQTVRQPVQHRLVGGHQPGRGAQVRFGFLGAVATAQQPAQVAVRVAVVRLDLDGTFEGEDGFFAFAAAIMRHAQRDPGVRVIRRAFDGGFQKARGGFEVAQLALCNAQVVQHLHIVRVGEQQDVQDREGFSEASGLEQRHRIRERLLRCFCGHPRHMDHTILKGDTGGSAERLELLRVIRGDGMAEGFRCDVAAVLRQKIHVEILGRKFEV